MANDEIWAALISAGAGGLISLGQGVSAAVQRKQVREALKKFNLPPATEFMYEAKFMEDPEKFVAEAQANTELQNIDPRLQGSQMNELQRQEDIIAGGGYTTSERGDIEQIAGDVGTRMRGQREAALQQAQRRGLGGSGLRMAQDIATRQSGTSDAARSGYDVAKGGALRSMQAGQNIRSGAGQMWGQEAAVGGAQDAINKANALAGNQGKQFNIGNKLAQDQFNKSAANRQASDNAAANLARTQLELQTITGQA